jgi:hypothetical protein
MESFDFAFTALFELLSYLVAVMSVVSDGSSSVLGSLSTK